MSLLTIILASLAALEHLYIFIWRASEPHLIPQVRFSTWIKKNSLAHLDPLYLRIKGYTMP